MRHLRILTVVLAVAAMGQPARAQTVYFYTASDTVLRVLAGDTASIPLYSTSSISQYAVHVFLDSSRVHIVGTDSIPGSAMGAPTINWISSEEVVLSAAAASGSATSLAIVTFEAAASAQEGSLVSLEASTLLDATGADVVPTHRTRLLNVCQANRVYGDVDVNRIVNSRDALVTLTAAVGIPVTGAFEMQWGDVDLDMQVTSRDALFILSYGVGLTVGIAPETGRPAPNRCAPLQVAPADMAFYRGNELYVIDQGDTVPQLVPLAGAPQTGYRASWSPDGAQVAYTLWTSPYSYEIATVNRDGSSPDTLVRNTANDWTPTWSPDGTQIAFRSSRSPAGVYVMDADGGSQLHVTGTDTLTIGNDLAWSPDGTRLAFSAYTICCTYVPWVADLIGQTLQPAQTTTLQTVQSLSWSGSSDSLLFEHTSVSRMHVMAVPDTAGVEATRLEGSHDYPWWAPNGWAFRSTLIWPYDYYLRRGSDGRHLRLVHATTSNSDVQFVMRWPNLVYVDDVSVSPAIGTIPAGAPLALTATVTNSDVTTNGTVPLTWVSRDPTIATVTVTGGRTVNISLGGTSGTTWIVVSAGGWRRDSSQVTAP